MSVLGFTYINILCTHHEVYTKIKLKRLDEIKMNGSSIILSRWSCTSICGPWLKSCLATNVQ